MPSVSSSSSILTSGPLGPSETIGTLVGTDNDNTSLIAGIVGGVIGLIMLITVCATLLCIFKRKRKNNKSDDAAVDAADEAHMKRIVGAPARTGEYGAIQLTMLRNAANKGKTSSTVNTPMPDLPAEAPSDASPSEATIYDASPFSVTNVGTISHYAMAPAVSEYASSGNDNHTSSIRVPSSSHSDK
jgi:hypothetical protein